MGKWIRQTQVEDGKRNHQVFPKCLVRSFMAKRSVLIGRESVGSNPTLPSKSTIRGLVCRNNIQVVDISERRGHCQII
jgi:hypothetical protein